MPFWCWERLINFHSEGERRVASESERKKGWAILERILGYDIIRVYCANKVHLSKTTLKLLNQLEHRSGLYSVHCLVAAPALPWLPLTSLVRRCHLLYFLRSDIYVSIINYWKYIIERCVIIRNKWLQKISAKRNTRKTKRRQQPLVRRLERKDYCRWRLSVGLFRAEGPTGVDVFSSAPRHIVSESFFALWCIRFCIPR